MRRFAFELGQLVQVDSPGRESCHGRRGSVSRIFREEGKKDTYEVAFFGPLVIWSWRAVRDRAKFYAEELTAIPDQDAPHNCKEAGCTRGSLRSSEPQVQNIAREGVEETNKGRYQIIEVQYPGRDGVGVDVKVVCYRCRFANPPGIPRCAECGTHL